MVPDLAQDGPEEGRATRRDRPKRSRKSWLKAVAQGLSPVSLKSRSPVRHFTRSPPDKSTKLDIHSLTFEGLEHEEPRSSQSSWKAQLSPLKVDYKDLSPTFLPHRGSRRPPGASGSGRSFVYPSPAKLERMETDEPERTPPAEHRGASPERAGGVDGLSYGGRSSGEYDDLPDILAKMKVQDSDSDTGTDWTGLTPKPLHSPGLSWTRSVGRYSPLSQARSSVAPEDVSEGHMRLPRTSSLPTMSPLSSRLTVCSTYSEDDITPWITTRDRGRRRGRASVAGFATKLAAVGKGCSPSKRSESSSSSSDGLWRETEPLDFPLNVEEDEVELRYSAPTPSAGHMAKGKMHAESSPGDRLALRTELLPHMVVTNGDDGYGDPGGKGFDIKAALSDFLRVIKCLCHACLPPDRRGT